MQLPVVIFEADSGLRLGSIDEPELDKVANTFFVRGTDVSKDDAVVVVKNKRAAKILEAVKEYNAYFTE